LARIVSFINYKGGVAKTTTAYHIGSWLALEHEKRVLLVDVDPQTNLTFLCATQERWQQFRDEHGTLASLYQAHLNGESFDANGIIWQSPIQRAGTVMVPNLDLVPSDVDLMGIDLDLMSRQQSSTDLEQVARHYVRQRSILSHALEPIVSEYDYVMLDCPPNLYLVTQNALAMSEAYIVTALPDHLSSIGLAILHRRIRSLNMRLAQAGAICGTETLSGPTLGGIIFVRVRLGGTVITNAHARKMDEIEAEYPGAPFDRYTTEGIAYSEAAEQALPVFLMNTTNAARVNDQYKVITNEFMLRFQA